MKHLVEFYHCLFLKNLSNTMLLSIGLLRLDPMAFCRDILQVIHPTSMKSVMMCNDELLIGLCL